MNLFDKITLHLKQHLAEPLSSLSDVLLALCAFYFYYRLQQKNQSASKNQDLWSPFFLFFGVSTFLGGIAHSILLREDNPKYDLVWISMQFFSGIAVYFAQIACIRSEINNSVLHKCLLRLARIQLILFIPLVFYFFHFLVVALNSAVGLIEICLIYSISTSKPKISRQLINGGFLISFLTVFVNIKKIHLTAWLNHNDLSHLIMLMSLILIYQGVKKSNQQFKSSHYE